MRAARYHEFGDPSVLRVEEIPRPVPTGDQCLVRVHATSLNFADIGTRRGDLRATSFWRLPMIPGYDVSGEVVECGPSVSAFLPGDQVHALIGLRAGGTAEYVCIEQSRLALVPRSISLTEAAAVPLAGLTALQALRSKANVRPGQRVLVNGATGGVGSFAVQIARLLGCHVTGVGSGDKLDLVRELGAHEVIDYKQEDFTRSRERWDVVFDAAGNRRFEEVRPVLGSSGRMVSSRVHPREALATVKGLLGSSAPRFTFLITSERGQDLSLLARWIDGGELKVPVDRVFPLAEVQDAHRYAEQGRVRGKVVVRIGSGD
jgi:NADPH:quinone reductase-like Zn-dependent oxidoreductase